MDRPLSFPEQIMAAYERHKPAAREAWRLYVEHCEGNPPPRVPGMDTIIRLAWRIECGRTIEEAAAREYVYRWHLASGRALAFGAPHTIGM